MNHQEVVKEVSEELYQDRNVLTLMLYGSVSRKEEMHNSDIDLLVIVSENHLQKRHMIRYGITIEFVEMHLTFLKSFIDKREIPILFALADGVVLFNKTPELETLIARARRILEDGPAVNGKWNHTEYQIKKRYDLTEIYLDLLDVNDDIEFHYIVSTLIASTMSILLERHKLWPQTRRKMMGYLKKYCKEGYQYIGVLLTPTCCLQEKRVAAKKLIEYVMDPYGGILDGDTVVFKVDTIQ